MKAARLSKFEIGVRGALAGSSLAVKPIHADKTGLRHLLITVEGPAARIPSTTNSRLNVRRGETIVSTINPEHKIRLEALTRLWESVPIKPEQLRCDADNRWFVLLLIHKELHRVDSHNLVKPLADWLQKIGLIRNDKFIDCAVLRNTDFGVSEPEKLYICLRRLEDVRNELAATIKALTAK